MSAPNLVLKYTIDGDSRIHTKGAVRIKLDGRGVLTVYSAEGGGPVSVNLDCIRTLSIRTLPDLAVYPAATPLIQ